MYIAHLSKVSVLCVWGGESQLGQQTVRIATNDDDGNAHPDFFGCCNGSIRFPTESSVATRLARHCHLRFVYGRRQ